MGVSIFTNWSLTMNYITIWDGEEFSQVLEEEANELIKADKAQDAAKEDGLSLKYRHQFTGYVTRELKAAVPPSPLLSVTLPTEAAAGTTKKPMNSVGDEAALDWTNYQEAYREATGKKRVSKSKVEAWMEKEGIK